MSKSERWLLPDGVDELLPPKALIQEQLRRTLLDTFANWGYELVSPPLIEYLESLLTGTGNDLDLQTFKITDQLTGRLMGVRADITPQVARIDSHLLKTNGVNRFCYADTVLHTRPVHMLTRRCLRQIGCELFGETSRAADVEIISLMIASLQTSGIKRIHVDLAHVGIYKGLVSSVNLDKEVENSLFDALRRKSIPELDDLAQSQHGKQEVISVIRQLASLGGGIEVLAQVRQNVTALGADVARPVLESLDDLETIYEQIKRRYPDVELGFDFCELRGYNYHTGIVFAAYTPGYGYPLAQGGRYDNIGLDFGRGRAATGFSADLDTLASFQSRSAQARGGVLAPEGDDPDLLAKISLLRQTGRVVQQLHERDDSDTCQCDQRLVKKNGSWILAPL